MAQGRRHQKEVLQCELEAEKAAVVGPEPVHRVLRARHQRDKIMDLCMRPGWDGACELSPRLLTGDILGDTFAHPHADQR